MKAKLVAVPAGVGPLQVDGFPEKCERSCKGALHLRPSSTAVATDGELAHIKDKLPKVAEKLRVLSDVTLEAEPAAKADEKPTTPPAPTAPAEDKPEEKKGKGKKGRDASQ